MRASISSRKRLIRELIPILALATFVSALSPFAVNVALAASPSQNGTGEASREVFRLHMPSEPHSLDPARISNSDASYFFFNLRRGLYRLTAQGELAPEGAETCHFETSTRVRCRLSAQAFWSDGERVKASDYVRAFRRLVHPDSKNPGVEALSTLKNSVSIHKGAIPVAALGVKAEGESNLVFDLERRDPEFLYRLTSSVLVPIKSETFPDRASASQLVVNGPYKIESWKQGSRVRLVPNAHYKRGATHRPTVEILFVEADETALDLYEHGDLTFLRRLPIPLIAKYKSRADFLQIPMGRFDYIGFGPDLKEHPDLRAALSHSADFHELQRLYDALGIPGCPGLSEKLLSNAPCVKFDLAQAKREFEKVPAALRAKRLRFAFSRLGGDDVRKGAEWFQSQWKKNLGITIDLESTEQGVYLDMLRNSPPPLFRKGVGLDRPTCLAAAEIFTSGNSENFIRLNEPVYEKYVSQGECRKAIRYLVENNLILPLGRIHFTLLASKAFDGWELNELNQLDLAELRSSKANARPKSSR